MKHRKPLIISAVAAATAIALGVTGWLVYSDAQLAEARAAYEATLPDLDAAQSTGQAEEEAVRSAHDAHTAAVEAAEDLVGLLGEGTDVLVAAADGTRSSREIVDGHEVEQAPDTTAGELPENPTVDDYTTLRGAVETLTERWISYADTLTEQAESITADTDALVALWQAQVDTAADTAAAAVEANPNASQEAKDAAVAAAEALTELSNPLAPEAVELWSALLAANTTLADQERVFQEEKAAEEARIAEEARLAAEREAAAQRQAAQRQQNSQPSAPRAPSGGGQTAAPPSGGSTPTPEERLRRIEELEARDLGIDPSLVNCFLITNGVRCEWPGGWREVTI